MNFLLFKFLHVAAAILWIGSVTMLSVLLARVARTGDRTALNLLLQQSTFFGRAIVGPAALVTLLAGIATAVSVGFDFGALWITWGFVAIFGSILLGATLIRRTTAQLATFASSTSDDPRLGGAQQRLALLNLLNIALLLSTVGAMIFKPTL